MYRTDIISNNDNLTTRSMHFEWNWKQECSICTLQERDSENGDKQPNVSKLPNTRLMLQVIIITDPTFQNRNLYEYVNVVVFC